tara:strand:+ start:65 stop:466 length:402 start_codon:yes stop_codon:yes gene_type:complete
MGIRLASDFVREPNSRQERLWKAVIIMAFEDCFNKGASKAEAYRKQDAHEWFISGLKDFENVCYMADIEPLRVRNRYLELLEQGKVDFTEIQAEWLNYKDAYAKYRCSGDKENRQRIMGQISRIREKIVKCGG